MSLDLSISLSDDDLAVLAHKVPDAAAWAQHAFEHVGAAAVRAKIEKYRPEYEAARQALGAAYKTRGELDAAEAERQAIVAADNLARTEIERAEAEALFNSKVAAAVAAALESR